MNIIERMYPNMSAAELSNLILKGKGKFQKKLNVITNVRNFYFVEKLSYYLG